MICVSEDFNVSEFAVFWKALIFIFISINIYFFHARTLYHYKNLLKIIFKEKFLIYGKMIFMNFVSYMYIY